MRIGIVLSSSPGYSETFLLSKIIGLQEKGYSVELFCQEVATDFSICKVKKLPNPSSFNWGLPLKILITYLSLIPRVRRILKFYVLEKKHCVSTLRILKNIYLNAPLFKSNLDWIHFGFGTLALGREHIAKAITSKMGVSFRGFDIGVYPIKYPNCYNRLWNVVDKIHVISDDIKALLYKHQFKDQAQVVKITPAIDVSYFEANKKKQLTDPIQIVTVARLHWKKGLDYTLEALALLKKQNINFHYTLIGDGVELENLKFLVYQLGIERAVTFTGKLNREAVRKKLNESQIYVQYSVQEGFCNAVLEAQAMGLLCVVSNAEGLSENILHEKTGWVVPMRKPKVLAEKIIKIINLPSLEKDTIISSAQKRVANVFNIKAQQEAFVNFYKRNE